MVRVEWLLLGKSPATHNALSRLMIAVPSMGVEELLDILAAVGMEDNIVVREFMSWRY